MGLQNFGVYKKHATHGAFAYKMGEGRYLLLGETEVKQASTVFSNDDLPPGQESSLLMVTGFITAVNGDNPWQKFSQENDYLNIPMILPSGTLKCRFVPTKCLSMKERHPLSMETFKHRTSDGSIKAILLAMMILPESQSSHCYYQLTNIHFLLVDFCSFLPLRNNLPTLGA